MKYLIIASALILTGCGSRVHTKEQQAKPAEITEKFSTICIDGVQYWLKPSGHSSIMAPRYDASTKQVVLCPKR